MLSSNWSQGSSRLFGCRVIRQKIGRAKPRKSNQVHAFMDTEQRAALANSLERAWRKDLANT